MLKLFNISLIYFIIRYQKLKIFFVSENTLFDLK